MPNPYDHHHQADRANWDRLIQAGYAPTCRRCAQPIHPDQDWQLGHTTDLALGGNQHHRLPEHARCNTSAGAVLGLTLRNQAPPSRHW